jgi:nicotinate-nucleotide pyrophosphorylase (carboxylating)
MSGIATKTYRMVQAAREMNPNVRVAATRKTTPGFRYFEKRAVQVGGGDTHRYALDDMVLIKNNHIAVVGSAGDAVKAAREGVSFSKNISCEVRTLQEAIEAIEAGTDIVLLDNFTAQDVGGVHEVLIQREMRDRVLLEASGGINEDNIKDYAQSGVDIISSGALTHSYESADFNMLLSIT